MPERAFTVNPVVSSDAAGEETIQDFEVVGDQSHVVEAFNRGYLDDFTVDSEGRYHHAYADVEPPEESELMFDEDAYIEAIQEANPQLQDALTWAEAVLPEDVIEAYNVAIDSSDLDELNAKVEWLLEQYAMRAEIEESFDEEDEEPSSLDDLTEDEKDEMESVISELEQNVPGGDEVAEYWQNIVQEAEEAGDSTYAVFAAATAAFHAGQVTAEQAIGYCVQNCDIKDLARVYRSLPNY